MKIPKSVTDLAVKHKITVSRDDYGIYQIWESKSFIEGRQFPLITSTTKGALNRIRQLAKINLTK